MSVGIAEKSELPGAWEGPRDCSSRFLPVVMVSIGEQLVAGSNDHSMTELASRFST